MVTNSSQQTPHTYGMYFFGSTFDFYFAPVIAVEIKNKGIINHGTNPASVG